MLFSHQVRELEVDLDNETRRAGENQKNYKKQERRLKDVLQQQEEDQKNLQHFKDQIDRLNKKVKSTKANQEEAVRFRFCSHYFRCGVLMHRFLFAVSLPEINKVKKGQKFQVLFCKILAKQIVPYESASAEEVSFHW